MRRWGTLALLISTAALAGGRGGAPIDFRLFGGPEPRFHRPLYTPVFTYPFIYYYTLPTPPADPPAPPPPQTVYVEREVVHEAPPPLPQIVVVQPPPPA